MKEKDRPVQIVKRMLWLAYQAASGPLGMGFFQAVSNATEEDVFRNVVNQEDYEGFQAEKKMSNGHFDADYVFGKMMKLRLTIKDGEVIIPSWEPRRDYQSWCRTYPTYKDLYDAAVKSLEEKD